MNDNNKTQYSTFKPKSEETGTISSITRARAQRREDTDKSADYLTAARGILKDIQKDLETIENKSKSQTNELAKIYSTINKIDDLSKSRNVDYKDQLDLLKESANVIEKSATTQYNQAVRASKSTKDRQKAAQDYNNTLEITKNLLTQTGKMIETNKEASKSMFDGISKDFASLKSNVKDLAVVTGLDSIYKTLTGSTGQNATYNNMRSQFNFTKSDYNQFKKDITSSIIENGNITKYGFQDALDYMNRLGELGITDATMAEEQMNAVLLGTKYLGLSTETQAKILKVSRDTKNNDLLQSTNETMVQIMNAQLGVSKEQLSKMVDNSANIISLVDYLGGNADAMDELTKAQAALTNVYGENVSSSAYNILQDIINDPTGSQYMKMLGNYDEILSTINSGNFEQAMIDIVTGIQNSQYAQSGSTNVITAKTMGIDENVMSLVNASGNGTSQDYWNAINKANSADNDTNKFLKDIQLSISDVIGNVTSWITGFIPIESLQVIFYTMAIAEMAAGTIKSIAGILKDGGSVLKGIGKLFSGADSSVVTKLLGASNTGLSGLVSTVGKFLPMLAGIAGVIAAIKDFKSGEENADKWGTSKTAAGLGGLVGGTDESTLTRTLKNTAKYAAVGAGLGSIIPALGTVAGAVVGGLIGLGTGLIGGENFANMFDSIGTFFKDNFGDATGAPSTSSMPTVPTSSGFSGKGDAIAKKDFPWTFTSPFGYRDAIKTKAGTTSTFHSGIDLASSQGTPIGANRAGTVSASGTASDGANYVIINDGTGSEELYWHLMQPSAWKKGDVIKEGQIVGYMGMTGKATGPHLHFGMRHAGQSGNAAYYDPTNYVNSSLFYPTEDGYNSTDNSSEDPDKVGTRLLQNIVSADTLSTEAANIAYSGIGDSSEVVSSINNGFGSLIDKLDTLSNRQDQTEEVLKAMASGRSSKAYQY